MKRLLWLVAVLALALAGCGGAADEGESEGEGGGADVKSGPGFDGKTIKLGVLTPLSGPVAVIGQPLTAGNQVYFDYVNSKGGIAAASSPAVWLANISALSMVRTTWLSVTSTTSTEPRARTGTKSRSPLATGCP